MSRCSAFLRVFALVSLGLPAWAKAADDPYFRTYGNAVVHWTEDRIPVSIDPRLVTTFGPDVVQVLAAAADSWQVAPEVPLFELGVPADPEPGVTPRVWVGFGDHIEFERELAITFTTTDAVTGEVLHAKVWLNPRSPWGVLPGDEDAESERYDLQAVMTHEFGHVLGLNEDENRPLATMHPQFHRGEVHQRSLEQSDEDAVSALYRELGRRPSAGCAVAVKAPTLSAYVFLLVGFSALVLARFQRVLRSHGRARFAQFGAVFRLRA